jgi:hypothetical protein
MLVGGVQRWSGVASSTWKTTDLDSVAQWGLIGRRVLMDMYGTEAPSSVWHLGGVDDKLGEDYADFVPEDESKMVRVESLPDRSVFLACHELTR